jgi:hypothetical protein
LLLHFRSLFHEFADAGHKFSGSLTTMKPRHKDLANGPAHEFEWPYLGICLNELANGGKQLDPIAPFHLSQQPNGMTDSQQSRNSSGRNRATAQPRNRATAQ